MKHIILMVFSTITLSGKYKKYHKLTHFWTDLQTRSPGGIDK